MDCLQEAKNIRAYHAKTLNHSRNKLFMFLSGWSGGPSLYIEKYTHPRLRQRHMPIAIGGSKRDQWLWCMNKALDESGFNPPEIKQLKSRFAEAADFMRNRVEK